MARAKRFQRVVTSRGNERGVHLTSRDEQRLLAIGRWYSLTVAHLVRHEARRTADPGTFGSNQHGEWSKDFDKRYAAVSRRMACLANIEVRGTATGPYVSRVQVNDATAAWSVTPYGATWVGLPWQMRPINPLSALHAWMAADAGIELERRGFLVAAQREMGSGTNAWGMPVSYPVKTDQGIDWRSYQFASRYEPSGDEGSTNKEPDVAVLGPGGVFIAIEIERVTNRPIRAYGEKLEAYRGNPMVSAVWYLCESETTANRVRQAAQRVFSDGRGGLVDFPLRVRVMRNEPELGWVIPNFDNDQRCMADLAKMRRNEQHNGEKQ